MLILFMLWAPGMDHSLHSILFAIQLERQTGGVLVGQLLLGMLCIEVMLSEHTGNAPYRSTVVWTH